MVKDIILKFGPSPESSCVKIPKAPVTIFVGPNSSGKSRVLAELHRNFYSGQRDVSDVIIDDIEVENLQPDVAALELTKMRLEPLPGESVAPGQVVIGKRGARDKLEENWFISLLINAKGSKQNFFHYYLRHNLLFLNGQNRLNLIQQQGAGDLQSPPTTTLGILFKDRVKRKEVRRIIYDAFKSYLVVDPTNLGNFRIKLSDIEPQTDYLEEGIHNEAITFHSQATDITSSSDGVKAFTGIIVELIAGDPSILFIDEPEAFLHPPLSYKLGKEIAELANKSQKRVLVSTHSSHFVMGCVQTGVPVNVVRLTYLRRVPTARILPSEKILHLMRNPLLRSTGVLEGLFYESVIVTESDADRAFYQEINDRLLKYKPDWGIPNCLFLNAQNKQTVHQIIQPLRELGIPAAAIVDVDIFKRDGAGSWKNFVSGGFIPEISRQPLSVWKTAIENALDKTGKDMKREGGIDILDTDTKSAANDLLNQLAEYGLFVVKKGELESWLKDLGASGHGPKWLIQVFEKMGENPELSGYIKPTEDDVWTFLKDIKQWLSNPNRKGIPT
jgi:ABC-type cobalamin/Fe3+-siderophores transport system ATPase subunit